VKLFLSKKHFYLVKLESLYYYENVEMMPAYPLHFGQYYLLKKESLS